MLKDWIAAPAAEQAADGISVLFPTGLVTRDNTLGDIWGDGC
jgi:hypothetical protein